MARDLDGKEVLGGVGGLQRPDAIGVPPPDLWLGVEVPLTHLDDRPVSGVEVACNVPLEGKSLFLCVSSVDCRALPVKVSNLDDDLASLVDGDIELCLVETGLELVPVFVFVFMVLLVATVRDPREVRVDPEFEGFWPEQTATDLALDGKEARLSEVRPPAVRIGGDCGRVLGNAGDVFAEMRVPAWCRLDPASNGARDDACDPGDEGWRDLAPNGGEG